jgi:hypothetical protein
MDDLLRSIYYDPMKGLRGKTSLYQLAKAVNPKVTLQKVKEFIQKQELNQVFTPVKVVSYPLFSQKPFYRIQLDLLDVSNEIPRMNDNIRFVMCVIDVYSRYGFVRLLKSKGENEVLHAFKDIINEIDKKFHVAPQQLDSDNESSFMSSSFKRFCLEKKIYQNFSESGDYRSKGIIERRNRTLRELIARYRTSYKTNRYVGVLPDIVEGYNQSIHSYLGASPLEAVTKPVVADYAYQKKLDRAIVQEALEVGDKVRVLLKGKTFDKKSSMIKWSIDVHKIEKIHGVEYFVSGRKGAYRRSELKKVEVVEENPKLRSVFLLELQGKRIEDTEENIRQHKA